MASVSKSLYLKGHECLRSAWLTLHHPDLRPIQTEAEKMRARTGQKLGEMARSLFPGGLLLWQPGRLVEEALAATHRQREGKSPLFEAAFEEEGFFARADILEPTDEGWFLWEVKSSTTPKDRHYLDLAFQWLLMESCGWKVCGAGLILVNTEWEWNGSILSPVGLFRREVVTAQVEKAMGVALADRELVLEATYSPDAPLVARKRTCRECDYLEQCFPDILNSDILFLGYVKDQQLADWEARGIASILEIPDGELTRKDQINLKRLLSIPDLKIASDLGEELTKIALPACFVDFETDSSAIPWLPGCRPYQSIPFQQATVMVSSWDAPPERCDFLWDPSLSPDQRPDFVQSLLPSFEGASTIIHYSAAEIVQLRKLAEQGVPGAERARDLILEKGLDLEKIVKGRVQHPGLGSKTTIKKVLPLLCPEMADAYGSMEISDGDGAMAAFQRLRSGRLVKEEHDRLRKALIDYCHLDSTAMVRVAMALRRLANL